MDEAKHSTMQKMTYEQFWHALLRCYDKDEARSVARWVLEIGFNISLTDIVCGAVERLGEEEQNRLRAILKRLLSGEPVQYVMGVADFGPRQFSVRPGVLIPRPETYELCQWILSDISASETSSNSETSATSHTSRFSRSSPLDILDIGTGSGCIACTLASALPMAKVTAWDISPQALRIARENAKKTGVNVSFERRDMLRQPYNDFGIWDIVVSNPPYICECEAEDMEPRVLDFEPEEALFVPDDDPVCFYLQISNYAQSALKEGGRLYFEINPLYDEHIEDILLGLGFDDIVTRKDQFGKDRLMRATWH